MEEIFYGWQLQEFWYWEWWLAEERVLPEVAPEARKRAVLRQAVSSPVPRRQEKRQKPKWREATEASPWALTRNSPPWAL